MINFINNLFKSKKDTFKDKINFKELVSKKEIQNLFKSFNNYSDEAELRFVGGCVRKIIKDEIVDDIDLSTNLKPENVIEILKKNNINFYETGIDHGTITAVINNKSFEITSLRKDVKTDGRHAKVQYTKKAIHLFETSRVAKGQTHPGHMILLVFVFLGTLSHSFKSLLNYQSIQ